MKFWKRTALCLALCAALLTGCVPAADTASSAAPTDPLTGQEALWPGQRPVAVTIENETSSTTQWGLSSASLVLEALTEPQSATSLCLVYPAVDAVPQVGPVDAGQDLYWRLLVGQQVLPVQRGGGAFDQNYLDYYSLRAVDALEVGTNAFTCDTTWTSRPLWRTSGNALAGVLRSLNISSALSESRLTDAASSAAGESESEASPTLSVPPLLPQQTEGKLPDASAADAARVRSSSVRTTPPALFTTLTAAPTKCSMPTAPPSWMPTTASRPVLTTCSSCSAPLPCGTTASRWTTT